MFSLFKIIKGDGIWGLLSASVLWVAIYALHLLSVSYPNPNVGLANIVMCFLATWTVAGGILTPLVFVLSGWGWSLEDYSPVERAVQKWTGKQRAFVVFVMGPVGWVFRAVGVAIQIATVALVGGFYLLRRVPS